MKSSTLIFRQYKRALFFIMFLSVFPLFAQSGYILSWDSEVGCLEYSGKRTEPVEDINNDDCLLTCEGSTVKFTLAFGNDPVASLDWTTDGGQILNTNLGNSEGTAEIEWPNVQEHGNVTVHINLSDGSTKIRSVCVTTKPRPQGGFEIAGQQSGYFCSENDLFFENHAFVPDGSQIVASQWDFGDGYYSNEKNPSHSYSQPGIYTISLTVYDECGCSNTWIDKIEVTNPGLQLSCPTVICEEAVETYTVETLTGEPAKCGRYEWFVDGGHIVQQADEWVSVIWDDVDEDGFGYIYFDQSECETGCKNRLVAKIPVITAKGTIKGGKTELCRDEQSRYALPQWPTTDVDWYVVSANAPNTPIQDVVQLVDQRNEIAVSTTFLPPGNYILKAKYTNTMLNCGGEASFEFTVLNDLEIDQNTTPDEICEGDFADFKLTATMPSVVWTIFKEGQTIATIPGSGNQNQASYQFTEAGHYTIQATSNDSCPDYIEIDVIEIPDISTAHIVGETEVCPGVAETYTFVGNTGGFDIQWAVDDGSFLGPDTGKTVSIIFDPGSDFEVSAKLVNPNNSGCESDAVVLNVNKFQPDALIEQTTGNFICTSSVESFEITGYEADYYEWTIQPEQLAHISHGQGDAEVDIVFNERYLGQTQGVITVEAKVCGKMEEIATYNFDIIPHPTLTIIDAPDNICPGVPFDIQVSVDPHVPPSSLNIEFNNISYIGNPTYLAVGPGLYHIQNIVLPNVNPNEMINVGYIISAGGTGVCGEGQVFGTIDLNPAPVIQVSHIGANVFCQAADIETTITANIQGAGFSINDIQWFYSPNGVNVNPITPLFPPNPAELHYDAQNPAPGFGYYWAEAENNFECTAISNSFRIKQDCVPPIPVCDNEEVTFTGKWKECSKIELEAEYSGNPLSVTFYRNTGFTADYTNPLPPTNTNNIQSQEFETEASGIYIFSVIVDYGYCKISKTIHVQVDYQLIMDKKITCGDGDYEVTIRNESTSLPGYAPQVDYSLKKLPNGPTFSPDWYDYNEAITALDEGEYELTLTLSSPGKPTCTETQLIEMKKPDASFSLVNEVCDGEVINLAPTNLTPGAIYEWEYQGAEFIGESLSPTLNGPNGNVRVKLKVTDPYGCVDSLAQNIVVHKPNFGGEVTAVPSEICEGDGTTLTYVLLGQTLSNVTYYWYDKNGGLGSTIVSDFNLTGPPSGEYWVEIKDNDTGCIDKTIQSGFVNYIPPPHISAEITNSVCEGEDIEITGSFSPGSTDYRISRQKDNAGYVVVLPWTSGTIDFVDPQPDPGNYQYKIEYEDPQTGCAIEEIVLNATVHELPIISVQIDDVECLPYRVKLSVSANQPGSFTWSNGMSGSSIVVDHGGPYQVRFKPYNSPCEVVQTIVAPKSPDEFIWIFPTGCFDYCFNRKEPQTYIIGPLPEFEEYAYELDGIAQGSTGPGNVPDFQIMSREGELTLSLDNGYCDVTSDVLHLNIPKACDRNCQIIWNLKELIPIQQTPYSIYAVIGGIQNIHNYGITVDLSSIDGVFTPGSIYIPANGYYDFATHNMIYMPYMPGNTMVSIDYTVSIQDGGKNDILCHDTFIFVNPAAQKPYGSEHGYAEMKVVPNPVTTTTVVYYTLQDIDSLGEARIDLYGLQGNLISSKKINQLKSAQSFDLSRQPSGTYFIVVYHQGQRIGQQILIKK